MALRNIAQFFSWERFSQDKDFLVSGVRDQWKYKENPATGEQEKDVVIGTDVEVVITRDDTRYVTKDGKPQTNRFEKLVFHVKQIDYQVDIDQFVVPVNPLVKIYGNYNNKLSISCDELRTVSSQQTQRQQVKKPAPPTPTPQGLKL